MAAVEFQANIDRRVAKLASLSDGEDSKRARKREFAAIGKLRKQLAALQEQSSVSSTGKRSTIDADASANGDGPSSKKQKNNKKKKSAQGHILSEGAGSGAKNEVEEDDLDQDVDTSGGVLSRKQEKQLVKSVNQKLALAATRKQLKAALRVFASLAKRGLQGDVHTYTNVINCAVRCGQLAKAMELYDHMRSVRGMPPNIVTLTVLLKGYCEAGEVSDGKVMLDLECAAHRLAPNLRTANTLLRGCVRSGNTAVAVATLHDMAHKWTPPVTPDASCIVAVVSLLSRSLRLKDAQRVLATYATTPSNDSSSASLVASSTGRGGGGEAASSIVVPAAHVSVAKCAAILSDWSACGRALAAAEVSLRYVTTQRQAARLRERVSATHALDAKEEGGAGDGFGNGKKINRGAKVPNTSRESSAALFLAHQDGEVQRELDELKEYRQRALTMKGAGAKPPTLMETLARVLPLEHHTSQQLSSAEGTGAADSEASAEVALGEEAPAHLAAQIVKRLGDLGLGAVPGLSVKTLPQIEARFATYFSPTTGCLDFDAVFKPLDAPPPDVYADKDSMPPSPPVKMEICSGQGEWAAAQAKGDPSSHWVALELRHDRVADTVSRMHLSAVKNLCVIGPSDARHVLAHRIAPSSLDCVFVNHPEPPERTGSDDSDGQHLLDASFLGSLARALKPKGTLTIVTDSAPYALSLAQCCGEQVESFAAARFLCKTREQTVHVDDLPGGVPVWVGTPGPECGHGDGVQASSFFDRMWAAGKKTKRYTIFVQASATSEAASQPGDADSTGKVDPAAVAAQRAQARARASLAKVPVLYAGSESDSD